MKPKYAKRPPMLVMRGLVNDKLETRERITVEAIVGGWGTTEHYQTLADMQGVMLWPGAWPANAAANWMLSRAGRHAYGAPEKTQGAMA